MEMRVTRQSLETLSIVPRTVKSENLVSQGSRSWPDRKPSKRATDAEKPAQAVFFSCRRTSCSR